MATLKYKDGSEWKEFEFESGAIEAPTSFAGVTPSTLKRWANDCKKHPEHYTQLLGQELTVQYSTITPNLSGNWRLVGLNKNNTGFVFMASPSVNQISNFISLNSYFESYNKTAINTALNSTYFNYFTEEWRNIIADSSIKYFSSIASNGTITTLDNVKLYLPSLTEISSDTTFFGVAPPNANVEGTTFDYFVNNRIIYFIYGYTYISNSFKNYTWTRTISKNGDSYNVYIYPPTGQIDINTQMYAGTAQRDNKYYLPICFGV